MTALTGANPVVPLLRLEGLRKRYGGRDVLAGIDLAMESGEVICLIGASGSGKSTLLRCVDLLERVDDGTVWFGGQDVTDPRVDPDEVRRHVGMVFQAYNLFPHLSVLDNVVLAPRRVHGRAGRRPANARTSCSTGSGWRTRRPRTPTACPVVSSSGSRWSARWPAAPDCCCSTRSPPRSTPSWWVRCWRWWPSSRAPGWRC